MDKGFLKYLKDKKDVSRIAIALMLGLALIFIGFRSDNGQQAGEVSIEEKIASACSGVVGVGECEVFVYSDGKDDGVESVIIVCEGADSVEVRYKLTEMVSSFLGIGSNRVKVEKKSG